MEEKIKTLAKTIVNYSLDLQKGEKVMITYQNPECSDLVKAICKECFKKEAIPVTNLTDQQISSYLLENTTEDRLDLLTRKLKFETEEYDAFVSIRHGVNDYDDKDIPSEVLHKLAEKTKAIRSIRTNERKWVLLNYPTMLDAHKAGMTYEKFKKFAFDVMTVDYSKLKSDIKPLKDLMDKTDKVRITGPNTDISFSIKGMGSVPCVGDKNIPDGELYSAPIKDSVEGIITYNTPCPYQGNIYHNVTLTFEKGKIVKAVSDEGEEGLNKIFDTDEGARYIGEFSLGFNPKILHPMGDILYDEKILGSLHFTPGAAYKDCFNGNESGIHWDMVLIQREEYGGGEIYFDDVLIRKDGKFLPKEIRHLNYEEK